MKYFSLQHLRNIYDLTNVCIRWEGLKAASKHNKETLEATQARLRGINDLYLLFAKKASAFNSWFENVEEDMSDPVRCHSVVEIQVGQKIKSLLSRDITSKLVTSVRAHLSTWQHNSKKRRSGG